MLAWNVAALSVIVVVVESVTVPPQRIRVAEVPHRPRAGLGIIGRYDQAGRRHEERPPRRSVLYVQALRAPHEVGPLQEAAALRAVKDTERLRVPRMQEVRGVHLGIEPAGDRRQVSLPPIVDDSVDCADLPHVAIRPAQKHHPGLRRHNDAVADGVRTPLACNPPPPVQIRIDQRAVPGSLVHMHDSVDVDRKQRIRRRNQLQDSA